MQDQNRNCNINIEKFDVIKGENSTSKWKMQHQSRKRNNNLSAKKNKNGRNLSIK